MKYIQTLLFTAMISAGPMTAHAEENLKMTVFKTPWCGCCESWTEAMKSRGFDIIVRDLEDLTAIKKQAGVPDALSACHTAALGEYVIEGHVPVEAIEKLMSERPAIHGIAVPGMPQGSLGMGEDPDATYTVYAFHRDPSKAPSAYHIVGD